MCTLMVSLRWNVCSVYDSGLDPNPGVRLVAGGHVLVFVVDAPGKYVSYHLLPIWSQSALNLFIPIIPRDFYSNLMSCTVHTVHWVLMVNNICVWMTFNVAERYYRSITKCCPICCFCYCRLFQRLAAEIWGYGYEDMNMRIWKLGYNNKRIQIWCGGELALYMFWMGWGWIGSQCIVELVLSGNNVSCSIVIKTSTFQTIGHIIDSSYCGNHEGVTDAVQILRHRVLQVTANMGWYGQSLQLRRHAVPDSLCFQE